MTQRLWHQHTPHPDWCGLTLLGGDGVVWRTPDNDAAFARTRNVSAESDYPQVQMVCQMALTSQRIAQTPDHSLTLFDPWLLRFRLGCTPGSARE